MDKIIDVKKILNQEIEKLKQRIKNLKEKGITPRFAVIIANTLESTKIYVRNKKKLATDMGIIMDEYILEENVDSKDVISLIKRLNEDDNIHGILLQLPLFNHLNENTLLEVISKDKDIDCFNPYNLGKVFIGDAKIYPCTPKGIMTILDSLGEDFTSKKAVVVGRSNIVGKPIASMLLKKNMTVTICHSKTKNLKEETQKADVLICACGIPNYITKEYIKDGAIVIDVGINRKDSKIVGDVDTEDCLEKVKYITKVPGGVGLMTVCSVMDNLCSLIEEKIK